MLSDYEYAKLKREKAEKFIGEKYQDTSFLLKICFENGFEAGYQFAREEAREDLELVRATAQQAGVQDE
jgi:hypothetical protein